MRSLVPLAFLPLLLVACGDKDDDTGGDVGGDNGPSDEEIAAGIWTDIDGYDSWGQYPDFEGVQASEGPHGSYVQVWFDTAAEDHFTNGSGDMPDGATIVKEGYSDEGETITSVTVMRKDSSLPDSGWFWVNFSADGTVNLAGDQSGCYDCHANGQDYNFVAAW